ncbi:MAG: hypothetical protein ACTFAL_09620 [Candidatus Electronema sp. V4]|uniref:hypothetical protein n=1 Tax=Candidatus Electronema sp. V4 TaxID=3454756 RepID=UPI0040559AB1
MSTAEVMTAALTAAAFFSAVMIKPVSQRVRKMPEMVSESRFSCRLAAIPEAAWRGLTERLADMAKANNLLSSLGRVKTPTFRWQLQRILS